MTLSEPVASTISGAASLMREIEARTIAKYPSELANFVSETMERKCNLIEVFSEPKDRRIWFAAKAVFDDAISRYGR